MPWIIGPPHNEFCMKVKREQKDPGGNTYVEEDPDAPTSGCKIVFNEAGRFFLVDKGKYWGERWKDILQWLINRSEWGRTIFPDSTDQWWRDNGSTFGVTFEKGKTQVTMKVKNPESPAEAVAHIVQPLPGDELEITTAPKEAFEPNG